MNSDVVIFLLILMLCCFVYSESDTEPCRYTDGSPNNFLTEDHRKSRIFDYMKFKGKCELVENSEEAIDYNDVEGIEVIRRFFCGIYNDTNHWRENYNQYAPDAEERDMELMDAAYGVATELSKLCYQFEQYKDVFPYKCFDKDKLCVIYYRYRSIVKAFVVPTEQDYNSRRIYYQQKWLEPYAQIQSLIPSEIHKLFRRVQKDHQYAANIIFQVLPSDRENGLFKVSMDDLSEVFRNILEQMLYYLYNNMMEPIDHFYNWILEKLAVNTVYTFDKLKKSLCSMENNVIDGELHTFNCEIITLLQDLEYIIQLVRPLGWVGKNTKQLPEGRVKLAAFLMFGLKSADTFHMTRWYDDKFQGTISFDNNFGVFYLKPFYRGILNAAHSKNKNKLVEHMRHLDAVIELYSENCKQGTRNPTIKPMYCLLTRTMKDTNNLIAAVEDSSGWHSREVRERRSALIVTLLGTRINEYASMKKVPGIDRIAEEHMVLIMDQTYAITKDNNVDSMKEMVSYLPSLSLFTDAAIHSSCSRDLFNELSLASKIPCLAENTLKQMQLLISINSGANNKMKVINSSINYKDHLFEVQLQNILQTTESSQLVIQADLVKFTDTVTDQFKDHFHSLENYFTNLALYDKKIADADISFIEGRLDSWRRDTEKDEKDLTKRTEDLMIGMLAAASTELVSEIHKAVLVVASAANPLDPSPGDIIDSYDAVARAASNLVKAGITAAKFKQFVETKKAIVEKFALNYEFLNNTRRIVAEFSNVRDEDENVFQNKTQWFLDEYTAYDPKVQRQELVAYQTNWESFVDEACETIFDAQAGTSQVIKVVFANKGDCRESKTLVQKLMATYGEMYEYQFDYIKTLSDAVKARNAERYSEELGSRYNTIGSQGDIESLGSTKMFIYKQSALSLYMTYRGHAREAVLSFCDYFEFKDAGKRPGECSTALQTLSPHHIGSLAKLNTPKCSHKASKFATIPIFYKTNSAVEKSPFHRSTINITKLYSGEEVSFKIPDYQWMIDNEWIEDQPTTALGNTALYLEDFRIYMLSANNDPATSIRSEASAVSAAKLDYTQTQGNEYRITPTVTLTFSYKNNEEKRNCMNKNDYVDLNPYGEGYKGICPTTVPLSPDDETPFPSVFSTWKIKVSPKLPLPEHATKVPLWVGIQLCEKRKTSRSSTKDRKKKVFHRHKKGKSTK